MILEPDDPNIEDIPAWFYNRMLTDHWYFGLLLTTGVVLAVECLDGVTRDSAGDLWIDATMRDHESVCVDGKKFGLKIIHSPTSRTNVSIRADKIVAAFELADT